MSEETPRRKGPGIGTVIAAVVIGGIAFWWFFLRAPDAAAPATDPATVEAPAGG